MSPDVRPPTQAEIEEELKKSHSVGTIGNPEIGAALAQFEKEQGGIMTPQVKDTVDVMSTQRIEIPQDSEPSRMVERVMKWSGGAIKNQRQAEYVLLSFVVVAMLISVYLFFGDNLTEYNESPIYQEDITPTIRATVPEEILKTIPYRNAK